MNAYEMTENLSVFQSAFVLGFLTQRIADKGQVRTKDVREAVESAKRRSDR